MDVNHRLPQIGVAQEKLNRAQVGAGFQQVGGEAVTQGVRMKGFAHVSTFGGLTTRVPDHLVANRIIGRVVPSSRKQPYGRLAAEAAIMLFKLLQQMGAEDDVSIF